MTDLYYYRQGVPSYSKAVHLVQALALTATFLKLLEALSDVEGYVDQYSICLTLKGRHQKGKP